MLMWEISSHQIPFADKSISDVYTMLKDSIGLKDKDAPRPPILAGTPKEYQRVMQKCWRQDPSSRPTMRYVVRRLEKIVKLFVGGQETLESAGSATESNRDYDDTFAN